MSDREHVHEPATAPIVGAPVLFQVPVILDPLLAEKLDVEGLRLVVALAANLMASGARAGELQRRLRGWMPGAGE